MKKPVEVMRRDWQGQARESGRRRRERRRASLVDIMVGGVGSMLDKMVDTMCSFSIEKEKGCWIETESF